MLSTFPVTTLSSNHFLPNPFPVFEADLPSWEWQEPPAFVFPLQPDQEQDASPNQPPQEQLIYNSESDSGSKLSHVILSSGSDGQEPNRNNSKTHADDEQKRRRKIKNRESARRSRWRKQRHLEDLRNQLNQLRVANRKLVNQLRMVTHRCIVIQTDNEHIRAESSTLQQRLLDISQALLARQLQQQLSSYAWARNNVEQTPE